MNFILQPWQLLVVIVASWINQPQQQVIDVIARPVHGTERATSDVFVGERVVFGYVRPWLGIPRDGA